MPAWLFAELGSVHPEVVVLMGATAAKSLLGSDFRVSRHRGEVLQLPAELGPVAAAVAVTVHPSSILRGAAQRREEAFDTLVADLQFAAGLVGG